MMINRKDTPAPFMQRAEPPAPRQWSTMQPPQTPQKTKARRMSRPHKQARDEFGSYAKGSADGNAQDERISHDLSLTDNMRHSVVDNMLMSLNPDQPMVFSTPKPISAGSDLIAPPTRHLHSSSTTSDSNSYPSDTSPDQRSYHYGTGRRSNSSSNFQSALGRIDSVHAEGEAADKRRADIARTRRDGPDPPAKDPSHVRKDSKGSGSSTMEHGPASGQYRLPLQNAPARRSASFDHGYGRRGLHSASSSGTHATVPSSLSQPVLYAEIDAAPTPTVPAGPRRDHSPAYPPQHAHASSLKQTDQRRNCTKSSKSMPARKSRIETQQHEPPMPTNNGFLGSRRGSKQITSASAYLRSRNTSPARQSEPLAPRRQDAAAPPKDVVKERPGFFRRVFGSSKGSPVSEPLSDQVAPPQTSDGTRASSRNGNSNTNRLYKSPPLEDLTQPPRPEAVQPQLVKKPSSFFRRRKKSISESVPAPSLPPHLQANIVAVNHDLGQPSPASSLRKVMNPYLDDVNASVNTSPLMPGTAQFPGPEEVTSGPPHSKVLRHRQSMDRILGATELMTDADGKPPSGQPREIASPTREIPDPRTLPNPGDALLKPGENSFLRDDSSAEKKTPESNDHVAHGQENKDSTAPIAPSFPADMTPRSTSKNFVGRSEPKIADSPNTPKALASRNTNVPNTNSTHGGKTEPREWLTADHVTPTRRQPSPPGSSSRENRVWLSRSNSDDGLRKTETLPVDAAEAASPVSEYQSANSTVHPLNTDEIHFPEPTPAEAEQKVSSDVDPSRPSDADRSLAKLLFEADESIAKKSSAAAWLGEPGEDRSRVRKAYMELFNWQNLNILAALRDLCGRLYLKGESQQIDRILDAFSTRWCICNPRHGFKATDVVHTICYSVLLLNMDLHQAEIETKMTRTQFLRNILPTIRRVVTDAAPDAFSNARASTMPPPRPWAESASARATSPTFAETHEGRRSFEGQRPMYRLSQRPSDQTVYTSQPQSTPIECITAGDCGPLVKTPFHGKLTNWENQVEIVLKDFFNSIRQQPLPLYGTESKQAAPEPTHSSHSLSAAAINVIRRTPSMLSKAGSENISYSRGRPSEARLGTGRWQSKTRSRPRLYPASTVASSRRSSFDEQSSVATPSSTSAWSKFSSFGRTQTTLSTDSFASSFPQAVYQQSVGFANALSQAIIREEGAGGDEESLRAAPLLEDESLELAGAPWAKEGILKHKHHLETIDKRAKDRNWIESFAVIEKGYMRLFSFSMNAKSVRQRAKSQKAPGGVVGGGNWADNAEVLGSFVLRQTIASALPPPGYSRARPHVWALSLPTGAVHLFQVGTPEIVKEFVTTANYWSARLSKEPLVGGISNVEYGWSSNVINAALVYTDPNTSSTGAGTSARPSLQSSIRSGRSSFDQGSFKPKLPGDKITISDWMPPPQSMVASALMEVDQSKALLNYVKNIEDELQRHNELRGAVLLAFSPRHPNSAKAMSNWERKSSYLLREIVKFRTYIDCLQAAQTLKEKIHAERAEKAAASSEA